MRKTVGWFPHCRGEEFFLLFLSFFVLLYAVLHAPCFACRGVSEIRIEHQARPTRRAADAPPARRYPPIWYCTVHICFRNLVSTVYIPCNRFANASAFAPRRRTIPLRAPRPIRSLSSPTRARRTILTPITPPYAHIIELSHYLVSAHRISNYNLA